MNKLKDFFWFCSGANKAILNRCPSEHTKYVGIGATVFFTGLFAIISGSYALYFIFNDSPTVWRVTTALLFGLIWGAMIFNLDRYIVSSMKKKGGFWGEFKLAAPRFILAAIIAFVISKPLELQIFHTSIEYELETMKQNEIKLQEGTLTGRYQNELATLTKDINTLKDEIKTKTIQRDKLDEDARKEADGTGGSKRRGAAIIYDIKKQDALKADADLTSVLTKNKPLIDSKQKEYDLKSHMVDSLKLSMKRGAYDGFDKRLDALGNVTARSNTIYIASIFVMLLFLAIELAPVLVKLLSSKGPYDELLEKHEHAYENLKIEQISKLNQKTNEKLQIIIKSGNNAVNAELEGNRELMKRIITAETDLAQEMIDQWKAEEMNKIKSKKKKEGQV